MGASQSQFEQECLLWWRSCIIATPAVGGDNIIFPSTSPFAEFPSLFIRSSWQWFTDKLVFHWRRFNDPEQPRRFVVTGSPGIGKKNTR
jgi:hypothetical protein